jgi:competence protein ComEC
MRIALLIIFSILYIKIPYVSALECLNTKNALQVHLLEVGQGESILITCPDAVTHTLIDAGTSNQHYPNGEEIFLNSLNNLLGTNRSIELAINTHPHPDHLYGFLTLLSLNKENEINIKHYIDNGINNLQIEYEEEIREKIVNRGAKYSNIFRQDIHTITLCEANDAQPLITAELILPDDNAYKILDCDNNLNDCSIIIKISYLDISFLLLGDATLRWEKWALGDKKTRNRLSSTVLKVGHHASHSTSKELLEAVNPDYVIISTGKPGEGTTSKYGFPEISVINNINEHLLTKSRAKDTIKDYIKACEMIDGTCNWVKMPKHPSLLSTAYSGTVSFYLNKTEFCIQSANHEN